MTSIILKNVLMMGTVAYHQLSFDALVAGVRGVFSRKDGLTRQVEIVRIWTAEPGVRGLDKDLVIDGHTNGVYSDGKNWYQICWKWVR